MSSDINDVNNDSVLTDTSKQVAEKKNQADNEENVQAEAKSSGQKDESKEKYARTYYASAANGWFNGSKQYRKSIYDMARAKLNRRKEREKLYTMLAALSTIVLVSGIIFALYIDDYSKRNSVIFYVFVAIASAILLFSSFSLFFKFWLYFYSIEDQRIIDLYELENMQEKVEEDLFESALKMSYKYLDQYYAQTREQANKGFLITISVTLAGAILLFVGIICMFIDKTDASKITVASGVIVEFISAIMFYLYNRTVQSMGNYHDKLFLSQNVSIALKISDSLSDKNRDNIKSQIVKELVSNVNAYIVDSDDKNEKTEEGK